MSAAIMLLPPADRLGDLHGVPAPARGSILAMLARADRTVPAQAGRRAQLLRAFQLSPRGWPVAALTRQADAGDAGDACWLRADPAYVAADMGGARLMAYGESLALDDLDLQALLPAVRTLFDASPGTFDAPTAGRWYLRLPAETVLPDFSDPEDALGDDSFDHLPPGTAGRPWRALLSEAQVLLHNHPWNLQRSQAGKLPVNSLWFSGAGVYPQQVVARHRATFSDDDNAQAMGLAAGNPVAHLPPRFQALDSALFDLVAVRDLASLANEWLLPALQALEEGRLDRLDLDLADGHGFRMLRRHRWRVWRRPLATLQERPQ